jgi:hypothetical protein
LKEWPVIEVDVGTARSEREAWLHSTYTHCPNGCGNKLSALGQYEPNEEYVYRLGMLCRACEKIIYFNYKPGSNWNINEDKEPLELVCEESKSEILTPKILENIIIEQQSWLEQKRPLQQDEEKYNTWLMSTRMALENLLEAMLELEKLESGSNSVRQFNMSKFEVADRIIELNGLLPECLMHLVTKDSCLSPEEWVFSYFNNRMLFDNSDVNKLGVDTKECIKEVLEPQLEKISNNIESVKAHAVHILKNRDVECNASDFMVDKEKIIQSIGMVEDLVELIDKTDKSQELEPAISEFVENSSDNIMDRFIDILYYQKVVLSAQDVYRDMGRIINNKNMGIEFDDCYIRLSEIADNAPALEVWNSKLNELTSEFEGVVERASSYINN